MPWTTPETFTAGQTLTAASMNAITENARVIAPSGIGAWTSYTPDLNASGGNPTIGSGGARNGTWSRIGNTVMGFIYITFGSSGFSKGTGDYFVSLPVSLPNTAPMNQSQPIGHGVVWTGSLARGIYLEANRATSAVACRMRLQTDGGGVTDANPGTMSNNGFIRIQFFYEVAS